jgi:hypothetical protein
MPPALEKQMKIVHLLVVCAIVLAAMTSPVVTPTAQAGNASCTRSC